MKKYLLAIASMALVCCMACSAHKGAEPKEETDKRFMAGAYAEFRSITDEEKQMFETVYAYKAKLCPQSVATQVVAGTNYKFICTDDSDNVVKVVVFKPLPNQGEPKVSGIEPITVYDNIVASISKGFDEEWETSSPEDLGVSYIYRYRSPSMGFAKMDINDDGVQELLLGDSMDAFYDIFTYNAAEGKVKHVFCGGERDRVKISGSGVLVREGSNSASDSFTEYYRLEGGKLVERKGKVADDDILVIQLVPFKL